MLTKLYSVNLNVKAKLKLKTDKMIKTVLFSIPHYY